MTEDEKRELRKVADAVAQAVTFHAHRDIMNGAGHLANTVRYSPLTTELEISLDTLNRLIET